MSSCGRVLRDVPVASQNSTEKFPNVASTNLRDLIVAGDGAIDSVRAGRPWYCSCLAGKLTAQLLGGVFGLCAVSRAGVAIS